MKPALTERQLNNLKKHYSDKDDFNRLKNWEPPDFGE